MIPALALTLSLALPQEGGAEPPAAVCFAEGTPESYVQQMVEAYGSPLEYNVADRWSGLQGDPRTVTWSFVPDGTSTSTSGGNPSEMFARLDTLYGGNRALWIQRFQESFDRWEEISGLTFVRVTFQGNEWDDGAAWNFSGNANRGDIRIGMRGVDGGGGTLAFAFFPGGGVGGNIVMDRAESWQSGANQNRFMRNVIMHEVGHAIGFAHVCSNNSSQLMEPFLLTNIDGPRQDDIRAVQRNYGDPFEGNNSPGSAFDIGALNAGSLLSFGVLPPPQTGSNDNGSAWLSIDANGENDYYRFTTTEAMLLDATVIPIGGNYQDADQQSNGSCPGGGPQTQGREIANLNFQVLDTSGTVVLGTADDAPLGQSESLSDILLDPPGLYFIRVFEEGSPSGSQLYRFELSGESVATTFCDATDGSLVLCPCGNLGSAVSGCDVAQGTGGVSVVVTSQETTPSNRATLRGVGFPTSSFPAAVVIRSNALEGTPVTFGDGLRCVGVPLVRLGATSAFVGISEHTINHGPAAGSGDFYYQIWFRNTPAGFCTPDAFNLSNGRTLTW